MTGIADTIRARLSVVDEQISRLRSEIEKAETARRDLLTAMRVLDDVGISDLNEQVLVQPRPPQSRPAVEKKSVILGLLGIQEKDSKSPSAIHKELLSNGVFDITIGNVRTVLWRLAEAGEIERSNRRYWRRVE